MRTSIVLPFAWRANAAGVATLDVSSNLTACVSPSPCPLPRDAGERVLSPLSRLRERDGVRAKQISRWTLVVTTVAVLVASCSTAPVQHSAGVPAPSQHPASLPTTAPSTVPPSSSKYYQDDGPGANPPDNLDAIPDAVPRLEPLHRFANRPYTVFGHDYVPATALARTASADSRRGTGASSMRKRRRSASPTTCTR